MNPDIHPGDVVEIEPHNALLWSVMIAGGDVSYWQQALAEQGRKVEHLQTLLDAEEDESEAELLAIELKAAEKELRAMFSQQRTASREMRSSGKMAIDAGLAEREVLLAERMAALMAAFANELIGELDLKPRDLKRLPDIVQKVIMRMEAPAGEHRPKPRLALTAHKKNDIFVMDEEDAA
jgi:hypothetical protein